MSISLILLAIVSALVLFGVAQRVLDRLRLTDRGSLSPIPATNTCSSAACCPISASGRRPSTSAGSWCRWGCACGC